MMIQLLLIKLNDIYSLHRESPGDEWLSYHVLYCDEM